MVASIALKQYSLMLKLSHIIIHMKINVPKRISKIMLSSLKPQLINTNIRKILWSKKTPSSTPSKNWIKRLMPWISLRTPKSINKIQTNVSRMMPEQTIRRWYSKGGAVSRQVVTTRYRVWGMRLWIMISFRISRSLRRRREGVGTVIGCKGLKMIRGIRVSVLI